VYNGLHTDEKRYLGETMERYTYGVYQDGRLLFSSKIMSESECQEESAQYAGLPGYVVDISEYEEDWVDFDHQN
jgi:hypothetical protein